jgi:hypothetical protein
MSNPITPLTPSQLNSAESAQWKTILKQALYELRVAAPAIVQSFDAATQTVSVQVAVSELIKTNSSPVWTQIPPINKVPIVLPRGGGFCLTLPLKAGDEGLLIFCDQCIDLWWLNGGVQPPPGAPLVQPQFERRRHDLTDCGFYPGMWSQPNVVANYSANSAQLRSDDGTVIIDLSETNGITLTAPQVTVNANGGNLDLTSSFEVNLSGATYKIAGLQMFGSNGLAIAGGLTVGQLYRNVSDPSAVCVVY